ncbi:MAG: Wzz/FepE/Etk N-terminal domain-containing protein [Candidatus Binatia bacterium]|jgi:uncharacterized protein involved in exopolysaccharide biosynthesis
MAHEPTNRDIGHRNGNGNGYGYGGVAGRGASGGEQVRDILHVIFKRKRFIGALFLSVALPGLIATLLKKPSYVATAKVMISTQRNDPTLQPTDLTKLETIQLNESLVNSEVQVVGSRDLLERVVRSLAVSGDGNAPPHVENTSSTFGTEVLGMGQNLSLTPVKNSNVIQIDYKSSEPSFATLVVNRVVDEYLAYHAMIHGNKGLSQFYDEQRRTLEKRLQEAEDALGAFSEREGVVSPKDEVQAAVRMSGEVSGALRDVVGTASGTEERIRVVREQLAAQPEVIKQQQSLEMNPSITQITSQLIDRQVDRITLLRKYMEKDRHVHDNAEEIAELKARLDAETSERPTVVTRQVLQLNPLHADRLRTLFDLEATLREMRARQALLEEELSRVNRQLLSLQQKGTEYDRLEEEVKNRRDTYELYVKREQEARITQAMDEQSLVNVDVVQRPALPLARADMQGVSMALSILAGLVVGIAGAFGREYLSRSLHSEGDVGRLLGLPVLASIGDYKA